MESKRSLRREGSSLRRMENGLGGKRVLVTGASGGIGSACARAFAEEGARLFLHYNAGRERAQSVAQELGGAPSFGADLTREHEVDALFARAVEELGGLTSAPRSPGAGPRRTSRSGGSRSLAGRRRSAETSRLRFSPPAPFCVRSSGTDTVASSSSGRPRAFSVRPATPTTRRRSRRSSTACCSA
jgi:NAD(P)-dependent dehydrogenase (short-subunit alcohol dehydrogenase family)